MHSGKPNSTQVTQLNSTQLFSSVEFPAVHWMIELATTCDDPQRFSDEIRRRFLTVENITERFSGVAGRNFTKLEVNAVES